MLTREMILAADDLKTEPVEVPEWGGSVFVRTMSAGERDRFEAAHLKSPERDFRARLAVACVCDEAGKPVFTAEDVPSLSSKSGAALTRIFEAASKLNRMNKEDVADPSAVAREALADRIDLAITAAAPAAGSNVEAV